MTLLLSVFRSFSRRKSNLIFPVIGVSVGVMLVILVSTVGKIGKSAVKKEISSLGLGALMVSPMDTGSFLGEEELRSVKNSQSTQSATPMVYLPSKINCANKEDDCVLWGIDSYAKEIMNIPIIYGRNLNQNDVNSLNRVCLIDSSYAKKTHGRENIVGKEIKIDLLGQQTAFTVVGITDSKQSLVKSVISEHVPCLVYVPYTVLRVQGSIDTFSAIALNVKDGIFVESAQKDVANSLYMYSTQNDLYKVENIFSYTSTIEKIFDIVTIILSGIAAISLVVSGLSVMTVMLFSVGERKGEIGVKKAIGASFFDILFEFLLESVIITLIGCLLGVVIGISISYIGCKVLSLDMQLDTQMIVICAFVTAAFGLIFGLYPAIRAAKLDPADTLRQK